MSGRGRGRGRGAPASGARLLLQRSAKEAGLDDGNLRGLQDITKPFLFPDYEWHSSGRIGHNLPGEVMPPNSVLSMSAGGGDAANFANAEEEKIPQPLMPVAKPKRSASAIYLINKSREIHHRFQNSAFFVHPTQEADVIRHGKERQRQQQRSDLLVLKQMGKTADSRYIPFELLRDDDLENLYGQDDGNLKKRSLDDLAAEERADRRKRGTAGENGAEDDGNLSDATQDVIEEEEEEDADYGTNHYDSDGEDEDAGGGGAGDEAVF
jgi:hypothetical protein